MSVSMMSRKRTQPSKVKNMDNILVQDNDQSPACVKEHPRKKSRLSADKPPSMEELMETESAFHSNLFHMQIKELLKEVSVTEKKKVKIEYYIKQLSDELYKLKEGNECKLSDNEFLENLNCECPLNFYPKDVKGVFRFVPPSEVFTVGSWNTDTMVNPDININLCMQIPNCCLQAKDYLNQRYMRKRAWYLTCVADQMQRSKLVDQIFYKQDHSNQPILLIIPHESIVKHVVVHLHVVIPEGLFKIGRFCIDKNNIRRSWYYAKSDNIEDVSQEPRTPHYNNLVLQDMVASSHREKLDQLYSSSEGLKDGLVLLKIWLRQRQLHQGHGAFSGFIMSFLLMYLIKKRKLNKTMTSYQVLRNTLIYLAQANWNENGITLHDSNGSTSEDAPEIIHFHQDFPVVFVDPTGYLNLCCSMSSSIFKRVKMEAKISLCLLENDTTEVFEAMFIKPRKFVHVYDTVVQVALKISELKQISRRHKLEEKVMDLCSDYYVACLPKIYELLSEALDSRLKHIHLKLNPNIKWRITEKAAKQPQCTITFGLILNKETATSILERGPPADSLEAKSFRKFWDSKSQLRRFQDGSICEAVIWPGKYLADRRRIITKIIRHVLCVHTGISKESVHCGSDELMSLLRLPIKNDDEESYMGTGEELNMAIHQAFDKLNQQLRGLKELPLPITTVQGIHPILRDAEVFPPVSTISSRTSMKEGKIPPDYKQYITVLCMLENSGKWPEDLEAVLRMKAAFYIQLGKMLHDSYGLHNEVYATHVIVMKDGFAFDIKIGYMHEIVLSKLQKETGNTRKIAENESSAKLERELVLLPKLTSTLHGLQQQNNSYTGAVRLAKRWLASQLLSDHIPYEAVELLVAKQYVNPDIYDVPCSPSVAFLRWLDFLAIQNWETSPVIVNLNNEYQKEDLVDICSYFSKNRSTLPAMFISTPLDRHKSCLTKNSPSVSLLNRLTLLAKESHFLLFNQLESPQNDQDIKQIFRPPLDMYDLLIYLNPKQIPRRHEAVDVIVGTVIPFQGKHQNKQKEIFPVVNYDPVQIYLEHLQETFGEHALFFYDHHGGDYIAVLWKPCTKQTLEFKISQTECRKPVNKKSNEIEMVYNKKAIIEDMAIMGKGLVTKIEPHHQN